MTLRTSISADKKKKSAKSKAIVPATVKLGRPVDFQKDIYPILENNCVACHNVAIDESKFVLEDVASILKGGKKGPAVVPKNPDKSLLYLLAWRLYRNVWIARFSTLLFLIFPLNILFGRTFMPEASHAVLQCGCAAQFRPLARYPAAGGFCSRRGERRPLFSH